MEKRKAVNKAATRRKNKMSSRHKSSGMPQRKGPLLYFLDKSGLQAIWEHFEPPTEQEKKGRRPPATIVLWFAGIYTALFGLASARYENAADRLELRASSVVALLANDKIRPQACGQIGGIQRRKVPFKPEFWNPISIFYSFFSRLNTEYQESKDMLVKAIESCKVSLEGANLQNAKLNSANLREAKLHDANMFGVELRRANLMSAKLHNADLSFASLRYVNMRYVELHSADLGRAELYRADLMSGVLHGAVLSEAKLCSARLWGAVLHNVDLRKAVLHGTDLWSTELHSADLSEADLFGADLSEADLYGARLSKAKLDGTILGRADFTCTFLGGTDLQDVTSWETVNFTNCNIKGIRNAPEGFREWALWNGAVEMDELEWVLFYGREPSIDFESLFFDR